MVLLLCPELMAKSFPFISSRYALSKSFFCQIYKFSVYLALTLLSYDFTTHPNEAFILISAISLGTLSLVELRLHFLHVHIPEHAYHNLSGCFNGLLIMSHLLLPLKPFRQYFLLLPSSAKAPKKKEIASRNLSHL